MLSPLLQLALFSILSFGAQWAAWRLRIPAITFLLIAGLIVGPITGLIDPDVLLGETFRPFIGLAVAIILFEGSLQLKFQEIREVRRTMLHVVIVGAAVSWFLLSHAAYYIGGLSWPVAATFAGLLIVTGPTVIIPILRHSKIVPKTGSILKWEGIVNDPVGVIAAVLFYEYYVFAQMESGMEDSILLNLGALVLAIIILSYMIGRLTATTLERGYMPEYLKAPFMIMVVVILFVACNSILHESGLIAVTVLGMTLTNKHIASIEEIRRFKETVSVLLIAAVFILLTASLSFSVLAELDFRGILFVLCVLLIRPISILAASIGTKMTKEEIMLIGWIAPRGIVCAAVAGVIGPLLAEAGYPDGEKLLPMAFLIVLVTVFAHGFTAKPLAEKLGLTSSDSDGLLIIGASPWTVQLAEVLKNRNVPVLIADKNWFHLRDVRLSDVPHFHGEILSEEAEFEIDFNRFGAVLAATEGHSYNSLICNDLANDYGREKVFQICEYKRSGKSQEKIPMTLRGRFFMGDNFDFMQISSLFNDGWRFRISRIGDAKKMDEMQQISENPERILAGIIDKSGKITLAGENTKFKLDGNEDDLALWFTKQQKDAKQQKEQKDAKNPQKQKKQEEAKQEALANKESVASTDDDKDDSLPLPTA